MKTRSVRIIAGGGADINSPHYDTTFRGANIATRHARRSRGTSKRSAGHAGSDCRPRSNSRLNVLRRIDAEHGGRLATQTKQFALLLK